MAFKTVTDTTRDGALEATLNAVALEHASAWDYMHGQRGAAEEDGGNVDPAADRALEASELSSPALVGGDTQQKLLKSWIGLNAQRLTAAKGRRWARAHSDAAGAFIDVEDGLYSNLTRKEKEDAAAWMSSASRAMLNSRRKERQEQYITMFEESAMAIAYTADVKSPNEHSRGHAIADAFRRMGLDESVSPLMCAGSRDEKIIILGALAWGAKDPRNCALIENARKFACQTNFNTAKGFWDNLNKRKNRTQEVHARRVISHRGM